MYTGLTGKVMIGKGTAADVAYISNWSVEQTTEMLEIAQLGKVYKEKKPGLQSWSASADGVVCFDTINSHEALFTAKKNGDSVKVKWEMGLEVLFNILFRIIKTLCNSISVRS